MFRSFAVYFLVLYVYAHTPKGISVKHRLTDTSCLKKEGYSFIIFRAFISVGTLDYNIVSNLEALPKNLDFVDIYMNPCMKCPYSAEEQIEKMVKELQDKKYRKIWIMVQTKSGWKSDNKDNCKFLKNLLSKAKELGKSIGIATNHKEWLVVMGSTCEINKYSTELWFIGNDNEETVTNFERFGGFQTPVMKELVDTVNQCGGDTKIIVLYDNHKHSVKEDL